MIFYYCNKLGKLISGTPGIKDNYCKNICIHNRDKIEECMTENIYLMKKVKENKSEQKP